MSDRLKVTADMLREAGWPDEAVERALSALDGNPVALIASGAAVKLSGFNSDTIIEYAAAPAQIPPPAGYLAILAQRDRLSEALRVVEWGSCDGCGQHRQCPHCGAERHVYNDEGDQLPGKHESDCPVGLVRAEIP